MEQHEVYITCLTFANFNLKIITYIAQCISCKLIIFILVTRFTVESLAFYVSSARPHKHAQFPEVGFSVRPRSSLTNTHKKHTMSLPYKHLSFNSNGVEMKV